MSSEKTPLSPADAIKLLDRLSTDDDFRARFAASPAQALSEIDAALGDASVLCCLDGTLASPAEFEAAREALLEHLTRVTMFNNPHCFVTGEVDASLKRTP
jgi:putative modified peptide